jgi:coenzyme A diphosphatase NUDT7
MSMQWALLSSGPSGYTGGPMNIERMKTLIAHLASSPGRIIAADEYRESSVVVPLIAPREANAGMDDWRILYEKRAAHIPQGGESCFPGGRIDPGESHHQAAFRELEEETGISPGEAVHTAFYGSLVNPGGRLVHVWIALLPKMPSTRPNEEVEKLFTCSLGQLRQAPQSVYRISTEFGRTSEAIPFERYGLGEPYARRWRGADLQVLFYEDLPELIWGMTAKISRELVDQLYAAETLT